jgi:cell division protein FtsX
MNRDLLQDALQTFNGGDWYGWRTHDDNGNKIPNDQRMCWEHTIVIKEGAIKPTKQQVETKIQELKDVEVVKEQNKQSALTKLSALGLTEAEIKSIIG